MIGVNESRQFGMTTHNKRCVYFGDYQTTFQNVIRHDQTDVRSTVDELYIFGDLKSRQLVVGSKCIRYFKHSVKMKYDNDKLNIR